jgi:hypothetical protein
MRSGTYILTSLSERMRYRYLSSPKLVRIVLEASLFDQLNISGIDIPIVLANEDRRVGQSIQPVTLYLTVIVSPILPIGSTNLQSTEVNESPPSEDTSSIAQDSVNITRSVATGSQTAPLPADLLRGPSEMNTPLPPAANRSAVMSLAKDAIRDADKAMPTINLSDTWQSALGRIEWVMDTLSPVAGVSYDVLFPNPWLDQISSSASSVCTNGL